MSHLNRFTFRDGRSSCVENGVPRVLGIKSCIAPYPVVSYLCLDCDQQVDPKTDRIKILLVDEDTLEENTTWWDSIRQAWVTVPIEGPPPARGLPDNRVLKEDIFWEEPWMEAYPR